MKRRRFLKILLGLAALAAALGFVFRGELKRWAYEDPWRDRWQQPGRVLEALGVGPGMRIADIGSGSGYFTLRLARAAGAAGRVFAADIDAEMNAYLARRAAEEGLSNVEVILAAYDDPRLPEDGVDLIFLGNTYHHLEDRAAYFRNARRYLRPGGRLAIVDFRRDAHFLIRLSGHHTDAATVRREMEEAGYVPAGEFDFLSRQLFLVFAPAEESAAPAPGR